MSLHSTQAIGIPVERAGRVAEVHLYWFQTTFALCDGMTTGVVEQFFKLGCEISVLQFWLAFNSQQRNQFTSHVLNVRK